MTVQDEAEDRARRRVYFWCGFVVAGILTAGIIAPGFSGFGWIGWVVVAAVGVGFGYASQRWGDDAWEWLSDRVRYWS